MMLRQSLSVLLAFYLVVLWHPRNATGDDPGKRESSTSYWDEERREQTIVVSKSKKELQYRENGQETFTCRVAISDKKGRKRRRGDGCTPEGRFAVAGRYANALLLDYPDAVAASEALSSGLITRTQYRAIVEAHKLNALPPQDTALGSYVSLRPGDLNLPTRGDIKLSDKDFAWLSTRLRDGATIEILP